MLARARKRLGKRAKRGFRGYPVATVAIYGGVSRLGGHAAFAINGPELGAG
jgi:hypothetical protein